MSVTAAARPRPDAEHAHARRERLAHELLDRLTPLMSTLGIIFVLVILGEDLARDNSTASAALAVIGWALWAVFGAEFVARMVIAPSAGRFLRKNWWQMVFLVLPFLRVFRLLRNVRALRGGRVVSGVSVVVFGSLAGVLGAYFLDTDNQRRTGS